MNMIIRCVRGRWSPPNDKKSSQLVSSFGTAHGAAMQMRFDSSRRFMYQSLGSVIPLPFDRQEEIGKEFEEIFRAAWQDNAFDWRGIIKHFADKYGHGKADAYFMGILVGKQFAKDLVIGYAKDRTEIPSRELLAYVDSEL